MTRSLTTSSFATEHIFAKCYTTSVYSCSVAFVLPPDCFHFISASNLSSINSDMFLDLRKAIFVLFTPTIKVIFDNMNAGLCDQFCQDLVWVHSLLRFITYSLKKLSRASLKMCSWWLYEILWSLMLKGVELKTPISVQNPATQYSLKKKRSEAPDKVAFLQFFELQVLRLALHAVFREKKNALELNINNSRSLARIVHLISRLAKCLMPRKARRPFLTRLAGAGKN